MILDLIKQKEDNNTAAHPTMLDSLIGLNGKDARLVLSISELTAESIVLLFAGAEATSLTLVLGTYYLLKDRELLSKLQNELSLVMLDKWTLPPVAVLQRLPYLVCV